MELLRMWLRMRKMIVQDFEVSYQEPHIFNDDLLINVGVGDEYFTQVEHVASGTTFMAKTEYIERINGQDQIRQGYTDLFLDVYAGEEVEIVDDNVIGYLLIKKNGVIGWVPEEVIE